MQRQTHKYGDLPSFLKAQLEAKAKAGGAAAQQRRQFCSGGGLGSGLWSGLAGGALGQLAGWGRQRFWRGFAAGAL